MNRFEFLVDPTEFGLVADYLRLPRTSILFLLHVKSDTMLATVAEEIEREERIRSLPPWCFSEVVERHLHEGSVRVSSHIPLQVDDPRFLVDAAAIPRRAACRVIYFPPSYLIHTPGLFEGTLIHRLG